MPNPIVLEILENERNTLNKAIDILKYGVTGQKRRGRPPKNARAVLLNGHVPVGEKTVEMSAGRARQIAGLKRYWKQKRKAAK